MDAGGPPEASSGHEPVMVAEVLQYLAPRTGGRYLDLTVGAGGHARVVLERIGPSGVFVGVDRDRDVLERTSGELRSKYPKSRFIHANFAEIDELSRVLEPIRFEGVLLDLGASSMQLDDAGRGFSFMRSGPLDMRMDRTARTTAADLLRRLSLEDLERILREYGEERHARRIARAIVDGRGRLPLVTTTDLAMLVQRVSPSRRERIHPATRTFQALRIAVNDELGCLERFLAGFPKLLVPGGVIVVIAFHSLEDRLVKTAFRRLAAEGRLELLTRKPATATDDEVERNRRARSAKLRAARLIG